jgi:hypothetical protein
MMVQKALWKKSIPEGKAGIAIRHAREHAALMTYTIVSRRQRQVITSVKTVPFFVIDDIVVSGRKISRGCWSIRESGAVSLIDKLLRQFRVACSRRDIVFRDTPHSEDPESKNPPRISASGFRAQQFSLDKTPYFTGPVK